MAEEIETVFSEETGIPLSTKYMTMQSCGGQTATPKSVIDGLISHGTSPLFSFLSRLIYLWLYFIATLNRITIFNVQEIIKLGLQRLGKY